MKKEKQNSNIFKKMISAFAVALCVTLLTPGVAQAKSQVALNKAKVTVCTGKTYTLKMSGISKKVKWSTSDKNVVSIKTSGKKKVNCKITAKNKGTATVTAKVKVGKKTKTFKCQVKVAGHKYGKASYKWNKNCSKCIASKKCRRCGKTLKQTVKAKGKTTTKATCTEKGKKKYTAQFTKYNFGTKTKSVTIKAKGHKVNSDKKISYKWNSGYSKCTATYYCKNGGEKQKESVKASKKTTPATKTSKGKTVYTATFKTKGLETQTKKVSIPKLAYLTLNGKEVNSVTVRSDRKPVTLTLHNATAEWVGVVNEAYPKTTGTFKDNQVTISTKDKTADVENVTVTVETKNGQRVDCAVKVMFTPGEYNFGGVGSSYQDVANQRYYNAYGKNKGFSSDGYYDYVMICRTKSEYDIAYNFYHHRQDKYGRECDLETKSADINNACNERANYKSKARIEWEALSYDVQENLYDGDFYNYVEAKYGEVGMTYLDSVGSGFGYNVTSNAQLKQIVDAWTAVSGEKPSWYYNSDGSIYYTAFSDWAEWSGRDLGKLTYKRYDEITDELYDYTPSALPSNYKD